MAVICAAQSAVQSFGAEGEGVGWVVLSPVQKLTALMLALH